MWRRAMVVVAAVASWLISAPPALARPATGSVICIPEFRFQPSVAQEGQTVELLAVIRNCTNRAVTFIETSYGAEPPPCPVIDPRSEKLTFPDHAVVAGGESFAAPNCPGTVTRVLQATGLRGQLYARRVARLLIKP